MFRAQQPGQSADQEPADNKPGFPAETPTSEMTLEQQVEYWKDKSRKHESGEKSMRSELKGLKAKAADYDKLVEANKTEAERAIDAARAEGFAKGIADGSRQAVREIVRARLSEEAAADILFGLDVAAFVDDNGELKLDELSKYLDRVSGPVKDQPSPRNPHASAPRNSIRAADMGTGRDLFYARHPEKKGNANA